MLTEKSFNCIILNRLTLFLALSNNSLLIFHRFFIFFLDVKKCDFILFLFIFPLGNSRRDEQEKNLLNRRGSANALHSVHDRLAVEFYFASDAR